VWCKSLNYLDGERGILNLYVVIGPKVYLCTPEGRSRAKMLLSKLPSIEGHKVSAKLSR